MYDLLDSGFSLARECKRECGHHQQIVSTGSWTGYRLRFSCDWLTRFQRGRRQGQRYRSGYPGGFFGHGRGLNY